MLLCTLPFLPPSSTSQPLLIHPFPVCPHCNNTLTVSRSAYTADNPTGQNRLECRTCPYQFLLDKAYFERKEMKRKEVEDVMGGKEAWEGVDKMDGEFDDVFGIEEGRGWVGGKGPAGDLVC